MGGSARLVADAFDEIVPVVVDDVGEIGAVVAGLFGVASWVLLE